MRRRLCRRKRPSGGDLHQSEPVGRGSPVRLGRRPAAMGRVGLGGVVANDHGRPRSAATLRSRARISGLSADGSRRTIFGSIIARTQPAAAEGHAAS
jgi:hypothetical protein